MGASAVVSHAINRRPEMLHYGDHRGPRTPCGGTRPPSAVGSPRRTVARSRRMPGTISRPEWAGTSGQQRRRGAGRLVAHPAACPGRAEAAVRASGPMLRRGKRDAAAKGPVVPCNGPICRDPVDTRDISPGMTWSLIPGLRCFGHSLVRERKVDELADGLPPRACIPDPGCGAGLPVARA